MNTTTTERAARDLFDDADRQTRNIRFFYRADNCTAETLSDYRTRAMAQIRQGLTEENVDLDRELID